MIKTVNVIIHSNLNQGLVHSIRKMTHQVFVYGTLKRNEPNHHWLTKAENGVGKFISKGTTKTKYPLIIATRYNIPFLLYSPGNGHNVEGEIYEVDEKMLANLDILEDHPKYYIREKDDIIIKPGLVPLLSKLQLEDGNHEDLRELLKYIRSDSKTTKCWVYFLKGFKPDLLKKPMMSNYSSTGPHGLIYMESNNESTKDDLDDVKK